MTGSIQFNWKGFVDNVRTYTDGQRTYTDGQISQPATLDRLDRV